MCIGTIQLSEWPNVGLKFTTGTVLIKHKIIFLPLRRLTRWRDVFLKNEEKKKMRKGEFELSWSSGRREKTNCSVYSLILNKKPVYNSQIIVSVYYSYICGGSTEIESQKLFRISAKLMDARGQSETQIQSH